MENEIKIKKERILEAANKCGDAKRILKTIFPEVFVDNKYLNFECAQHAILRNDIEYPYNFTHMSIQVRSGGNLSHKGFYLSDKFNWELVVDNKGQLVLLPTKKY